MENKREHIFKHHLIKCKPFVESPSVKPQKCAKPRVANPRPEKKDMATPNHKTTEQISRPTLHMKLYKFIED